MRARDQSFTTANDETLSRLIRQARRRVVILAPGLSEAVAKVLADQWRALGPKAVSVTLDLDPDVCRLGYGELKAIELLTETARQLGTTLLYHPFVRIGMVISDDSTMIYSPTPLLVEAWPTSHETLNAIVLPQPPLGVLRELGLDARDEDTRSVGIQHVDQGLLEEVKEDLARNPPRRFDIARIERVFNAAFEFVEFELLGVAIGLKKVPIPVELMGLATNEETKRRLHASFKIVEGNDKLSGKHLQQEKARIAGIFLRRIDGYGNVVLRRQKDAFIEEVKHLRAAVNSFKDEVRNELQAAIDQNREALKKDLLPGILRRPPESWNRADRTQRSPEALAELLDRALRKAFGTADDLVGEMSVREMFKGVTYELLTNEDFVKAARKALPDLVELHEEHLAAKEA